MNILRKTRKSSFKLDRRRVLLFIFTLIMTTFAWITYTKILLPNIKNYINSWNIAIYVDSNKNSVAEDEEKVANKSEPIVIESFEVYPGMNQDVMDVLIKNNGEIPSYINYDIEGAEVVFLGKVYNVVSNANEERLNNPANDYLQKNEPVQAGGIASYKLINEEDRIPFDFIIEHTEIIEGGAEGNLKVRAIWNDSLAEGATEEEIDEKDELDSTWGYNITNYQIENPTISPIQFKLKLNSYGAEQSSRFVLTQEITPENYGDYVDYSIDLNGDGNTQNDWRIFLEDNENIYIISDGLVKNTMLDDQVTSASVAEGYTDYGVKIPESKFLNTQVNQAIINKFMFTDAVANSNKNYKAVKNLLSTEYWNQFVDNTIADVAVGGPTIKMFVKSWNQKYNDVVWYNNLFAWWNLHQKGYQLNEEDGDFQDVNGYEYATLYFPEHTEDACSSYWLASPAIEKDEEETSLDLTKAILGINFKEGFISAQEIEDNTVGIRPVVQLKSGIFGKEIVSASGERVWQLSTERITEDEDNNENENEIENENSNS